MYDEQEGVEQGECACCGVPIEVPAGTEKAHYCEVCLDGKCGDPDRVCGVHDGHEEPLQEPGERAHRRVMPL
jgi:hypothetical protein